MDTGTIGFPDEFPGKSLRQIPEMMPLVEEISSDPLTWRTVYKCRVSGEEWEEVYECKGHGEVPTVRRVKTGQES